MLNCNIFTPWITQNAVRSHWVSRSQCTSFLLRADSVHRVILSSEHTWYYWLLGEFHGVSYLFLGAPFSPLQHVYHCHCDSGSHHCPRYTGELTSHLCWAWLVGYWEHAQGLLDNNREEPLLELTQYLLISSSSSSSHHITSHQLHRRLHRFSTSVS